MAFIVEGLKRQKRAEDFFLNQGRSRVVNADECGRDEGSGGQIAATGFALQQNLALPMRRCGKGHHAVAVSLVDQRG